MHCVMYLYLAVGGGPFEIRTHFVHGNVKLQYQPGKTMEPKPDSRHLKQCDKFCKIQCESIQLHNMKLTYNILDSLPIEVRNQPTSKDHPPIFFFFKLHSFSKKSQAEHRNGKPQRCKKLWRHKPKVAPYGAQRMGNGQPGDAWKTGNHGDNKGIPKSSWFQASYVKLTNILVIANSYLCFIRTRGVYTILFMRNIGVKEGAYYTRFEVTIVEAHCKHGRSKCLLFQISAKILKKWHGIAEAFNVRGGQTTCGVCEFPTPVSLLKSPKFPGTPIAIVLQVL